MRSGILPGHRDETVRPQDDLFGHANGTWVRTTEIPGDRGRFGTFDMLREQSDERVRTIIERAAADTGAAEGTPTRKVGDLYRSFMDEARVDELGLSPIQDDLAAVEAIAGTDDLFLTLGRLARQGGPGLLGGRSHDRSSGRWWGGHRILPHSRTSHAAGCVPVRAAWQGVPIPQSRPAPRARPCSTDALKEVCA